VPNYLRTKLSPEVELEVANIEQERQGQKNPETVTKQVSEYASRLKSTASSNAYQIAALNKHIDSLRSQLGPESSARITERRRERATYSNEDTLKLVGKTPVKSDAIVCC
jgi:hypothetical protein